MAFLPFFTFYIRKRRFHNISSTRRFFHLISCCSAMASSDRHWPSMFRSKPCTNPHPWQHDAGPIYCRSPLFSGSEERSPDPKPRWSPRPEQIRILEAIFNSGVVNPPRDEIRRIRTRLQEYGQVGDANVFYWFQNRKSRSKNRQRHLHAASRLQCPRPPKPVTTAAAAAATSSSSLSEHLTGPDKSALPHLAHLHGRGPVLHFGSGGDSALCPGQQGYTCLPATSEIVALAAVPEHELWRELLGGADDGREYFKMQLHHFYAASAGVPTAPSCINASASFDGPVSVIQELRTGGARGGGEGAIPDQSGGAAGANNAVFASEAALQVVARRPNVREAFGQEVVLVDHSGRPLLTDEGDFDVLPLHHGAAYYQKFESH